MLSAAAYSSIRVSFIPKENQKDVLAQYFGLLGQHVLLMVENNLRANCISFKKNHVQYCQLSNGGFYFSINDRQRLNIKKKGNHYEGYMSGDAYSLAACLDVYFLLSFKAEGQLQKKITALYHATREYASEHPESAQIMSFVD